MSRYVLVIAVVAALGVATVQLAGCGSSSSGGTGGDGGRGGVAATVTVVRFPGPMVPIPGATVTVEFWMAFPTAVRQVRTQATYTQVTDSQGVAAFPSLPEGLYRVNVVAQGYAPHPWSSGLMNGGMGVKAGGVTDWSFVMQGITPVTLSMSVTDAGGNAQFFNYWLQDVFTAQEWSGQGAGVQARVPGLPESNYDMTVKCGPCEFKANDAPLSAPKGGGDVIADMQLPAQAIIDEAFTVGQARWKLFLVSVTYRPTGNELDNVGINICVSHSTMASGEIFIYAHEKLPATGDQPATIELNWPVAGHMVANSVEGPEGKVVEVPTISITTFVSSFSDAFNSQTDASESTIRTPDLPTEVGKVTPYSCTFGPFTYRFEIVKVN